MFLYELLAQYGVHDALVSDNGTQFLGNEIKSFFKRHVITDIFIPPYHPKWNEQVESFVDTFNKALGKMRNKIMTKHWKISEEYAEWPPM